MYIYIKCIYRHTRYIHGIRFIRRTIDAPSSSRALLLDFAPHTKLRWVLNICIREYYMNMLCSGGEEEGRLEKKSKNSPQQQL